MPVSIAGMHRSGTSLVAQMLRECGLELGPMDDLLPPNVENREGFWENRRFVALNDELLATLGGSWDSPPALDPGWETAAELDHLRERARALVADFDGHEPWGWKDPRNSLTARFWQQIVPHLHVVACVRHPGEVVASLERRGLSTDRSGFELWLTYNRALVSAVDDERLVVTHYDLLFAEPAREVRRLVDFLELEASDVQVARAAAAVNELVRHHEVATEADGDIPAEVLSCYTELCRSAGMSNGSRRDGHAAAEPTPAAPAEAPRSDTASACRYTHYDDSPGSTHNMVVALVPRGARVLEFGCATGYMSEVLKQRRGATVTGVEVSPAAAETAAARAERVIVGDAESLDLEETFGQERFDVILFADVLEHLRDPLTMLRRVRGLLTEAGSVIASLPNVAHGSVRLALLGGEFRPRETGLLDETHLHFFTRETLQDLFEEAGYVLTLVQRRRVPVEEAEIPVPSTIPAAARENVLSDPDATTYQFVVVAAPAGTAAELHALRDRLRRTREELEKLRPAWEQLHARSEELAALREEHENLRLAHEAVRRRMVAERAAFAEHVRELEDLPVIDEELVERQRRELAEQARVIDDLARQLSIIANSRSIRYTAPIRGLFAVLRGRRR